MTTRNFKLSGRRPDGFSLIEVMIAVLVLATGLLAMAALQATLVRNSADAKARSQVVAFIDRVFDAQRATPYANIPVGASVTNLVSAADITALQNATGVSNVTVTAVSTRYIGGARTASPRAWLAYGSLTATEQARVVAEQLPEYKEIDLTVRWTDATGDPNRQLGLSTIVSPIALSSNTLLNTLPNDGGGAIMPVVRTDNPAGEGVIPIAVGNNTDTAATNPKPELDSTGNVLSTSFDALTYTNENTDARIQRRVETKIVTCLCQYGAPPSDSDVSPVFKVVVRPTYWNGTNYVDPAPVAGPEGTGDVIPPAWSALDNRGRPVRDQSPLCDDCCRDHHDVDGVDVRFDPLRRDHNHFLETDIAANGDGATRVDPQGTGVYSESCRFIRVNGLQRVATDANLEHMNLLKTATASTSTFEQTSFIPDRTASDNYASFVIRYLAARIIPIGQDNVVDATALENDFSLNDPSQLDIDTDPADVRFLHNRGLYLDHLEADAIEELQEQLADCSSPSIDCILANIPFVTVNTTELGRWDALDPSSGGDVSNILRITDGQGTYFTLGGSVPNRGQTNAGDDAQADDEVNATVKMQRSNTGLVIADPIDLEDRPKATDFQLVHMTGTPPSTAITFDVSLDFSGLPRNSYSNSSNPVRFDTRASSNQTCPGDATVNTTYHCSIPVADAASTKLIISNFNRVSSQRIRNPCSGANGNVQETVCLNYTISSVTGGTFDSRLGTDGKQDEAMVFTLSPLATTDPITTLTATLAADPNGNVVVAGTCSGANYFPGTCN